MGRLESPLMLLGHKFDTGALTRVKGKGNTTLEAIFGQHS